MNPYEPLSMFPGLARMLRASRDILLARRMLDRVNSQDSLGRPFNPSRLRAIRLCLNHLLNHD